MSRTPGRGRPQGREEVIDSLIQATLDLWTESGAATLSLRSVAAHAGVNYGLIYRHFGTKEALVRAAMERVVNNSAESIVGAQDLGEVIDLVLPRSRGSHARLLAWAILESMLDDVLPDQDPFSSRLLQLATDDEGLDRAGKEAARFRAANLVATLYGWKLFEPYLRTALGLERVSARRLESLIHEALVQAVTLDDSQP